MASDSIANSNPTIKVAALCGSLRRASHNRGFIRCATEICNESIPGMKVEFIDIESLPFVNTDLEKNGTYPPIVEVFRQKILEADCILFASPEYNYSVPALLKNAIDWASRPPNVWADKTAAIVSAAGGSGGNRCQYQIRQIGVFIDLHFINKPELFIVAKAPQNKFDEDGNVNDDTIKKRLMNILLSLRAFTLRLRHK
ncbi:hypothetical protein LUZ60_015538 [Juncus effusus]|nr:hypothetical protein LUZ60_015538 [Juncus effusus]